MTKIIDSDDGPEKTVLDVTRLSPSATPPTPVATPIPTSVWLTTSGAIIATAGYAFHTSRAGEGLLKRLVPAV